MKNFISHFHHAVKKTVMNIPYQIQNYCLLFTYKIYSTNDFLLSKSSFSRYFFMISIGSIRMHTQELSHAGCYHDLISRNFNFQSKYFFCFLFIES